MTATTAAAPAPTGDAPSGSAYVAPQVAGLGRLRAAQLAFWIYIVLIVVILTLGGVAVFCIAKGHRLLWAEKGWVHFKIACG